MNVLILFQFNSNRHVLERLKQELKDYNVHAELFNIRTFEYSGISKFHLLILQKLTKVPKLRVIIYKLFRKSIVSSLSKEFDLIDVHFYSKAYDHLLKKINKPKKVVFWGSDLYRVDEKRINQIKGNIKSFKIAHFLTPEMNEFALEKGISNDINVVQPFGVVHFDVIEKLSKMKPTERRSSLKNTSGKIMIAVGYNGSKSQQHLKIIEELITLDQELKNKIHLVFLMTYGGDKDYLESVEKKLITEDFKYTLVKNRLSELELSKIRLDIDITINFQVTDGFSSSIQEHFYAGNIMILADWLPYNWLKEKGMTFYNIDLSKLETELQRILQNMPSEKQKAKKNTAKIELISKWKECSLRWYNIYCNQLT